MATAREAIEVQARLKDDFTRPLRGVSRSLGTFTKGAIGGFGRLIRSVTSFRGLLIGLGGAYVVRALSRVVTEAAKLGDQFQKLAIRTGTSVEFLSEMKFAAEQSGVSFESLSKAITRGQRALGDYTLFGLKEAKDSFAALGPEVVAAVESGEQFEDILPKVAEALSQVASDSEKATIAQKLFGRAGAELLPLFEDGARGIEELREEARKLGLQWDQLGADTSAEFNDALNRLERSFEALQHQLALGIMPVLTEMFDGITDWLRENRHDILQFFREDLPDAFYTLEKAVLQLHVAYMTMVQGAAMGTQAYGGILGRMLWPGAAADESTALRMTEESKARLRDVEKRHKSIQAEREYQAGLRDFLKDQPKYPRTTVESFQAAVRRSEAQLAGGSAAAGYPTGLPTIPQWAIREAQEAKEVERRAKILDETVDRIKRMFDPMIQMQGLIWQTADAFADGLGNALVDTIKNLNDAGKAFERFATSLLDMAARAAAGAAVRTLIGAAFAGAAGALGGSTGGGGGGTYGATAAGRTASSPPQFNYPGMQHGGIVPPGVNQLVMAHGGGEGEAFVRLGRGGRIPVEFAGGGGGGDNITIINVQGDSEERIVQVLGSRAEVIRNIVAQAYQQRPAYRSRYG